ncbi:MAG: aminotransferase class I/II-fold pyridoxal phosphate-dependent enzyme, partial [Halobacteriales archaeon]
PSGAVFSDAAIEAVRDLAVDHDVAVVIDESYTDITYGAEPTSVGALEGMAERTVTVSGFSKSYAMTGWRLGYFAGPGELIDQAGKVQSHSVSCAANFVQHAGVAALEAVDEAVEEMVTEFEARRDLLVDLLAGEGVDVAVPEGAFYLMLPVDDDDQAWCETALEEAHVATVPGSAFGTPGYSRVSYANSRDRIREAVERLAGAELL